MENQTLLSNIINRRLHQLNQADMSEVPLARYLYEYTIEINMGRQFGHSTWIRNEFEKDLDAILISGHGIRQEYRHSPNRLIVNANSGFNILRGRTLRPSKVLVDASTITMSNEVLKLSIIEALCPAMRFNCNYKPPIIMLG